MDRIDIYKDIATRTGGDVYLGVVGPVRTGKSTFIKRFMETLVIPKIEDKNKKARALDELPQSADGKTIMTTEPKFVPNEAVKISLSGSTVKVRLIDCVGYLVEGAVGSTEEGKARLVRTPWSDENIPFSEAAAIGTEKVIREHSTVGILVTTDGSITEIKRSKYVEAEEKAVKELKASNKPFVMVLNTTTPASKDTEKLREALEERYGVTVVASDVLNMSEQDIEDILKSVLYEFNVKSINVDIPVWMRALDRKNDIIEEILREVKRSSVGVSRMRDINKMQAIFQKSDYFESGSEVTADMGTGSATVKLMPKPDLFNKILSAVSGTDLSDDYKLMSYIKELSRSYKEYEKIRIAMEGVSENGYGVIPPDMDEMELVEPEIVKRGNQFGVKLKASAPSIHIMKIDVDAEVSPIVGSEQQGEELAKSLMTEFAESKGKLWETNFFGKSLRELVREGIKNKIVSIPTEVENKMRRTMGKIVNEGRGGVICILL